MPEPYNYNIAVPDITQSIMGGVQSGLGIANLLQQQAQAKKAALQQQAMQAEIAKVAENPTLGAMRRLVINNPSLAAPYKDVMAAMSEEQKSNLKGQAWGVFSALQSGRKDIAIKSLSELEEAARNSGQTGYADGAKWRREMLESDETGDVGDKTVLIDMGTFLASEDPDGYKKYMDEQRALAEAPAKLSKAKADALIAQNKAKMGEDKQTLNTETGIYERVGNEWVSTGLKPFKQPGVQVSLNEGQKGFENETTLRKEFNAEAKPFNEVSSAFGRLESASKDDTGASDIAMIYSYMKMLDPGSVVREGEFATAENAGGVGEKIRNLYNKAVEGTRLTPKVRADYLNVAKRLNTESKVKFNKLKKRYRGISERAGLNPENTVTLEDVEQEPNPDKPRIVTVDW